MRSARISRSGQRKISFRGRVAVVTGAGSGIGRALAVALAKRGAHLALSDIDLRGVSETAKQCDSNPIPIYTAALDVADSAQFADYATVVRKKFGGADLLFNNAGISGTPRLFADTPLSSFEQVMAVNFWGIVNGAKAFFPLIMASDQGAIVNISSLNGLVGQGQMAAYCASKFAVSGFTASLAAEVRAAAPNVGPLITCVYPGGVKTQIATAISEAVSSPDLSQAEKARLRHRQSVYDKTLLKMSAARAAKTILHGVKNRKSRIVVGADAKWIDRISRLAPGAMPGLIASWERKTFGAQ